MKTYGSKILLLIGLGLVIMSANSFADMSDYTSVPPFILRGTDANVLLNLSIETPMQGAAYNDQRHDANGDGDYNDAGDCSGRAGGIGKCYFEDKEYLGIFDPDKCYTYSSGRFEPSGATNADHECSGKWSGNFLNWATMTAIDEFRWALTGGNRVVDNTTETVVERANMGLSAGHGWYPYKAISASSPYNNVAPSTVTPYSDSTIFIYNHGYQFDIGTSAGGHQLAQNLNVRVKVCDPSEGLEDNCVSCGNYYKPEGLIQNKADKMRFALMGYARDNDQSRDGGVLRSNMKYVGPKLPDGTDNTRKEFGTDGIFIIDPENATEGQSGVISYLNKFGANGYKSYDPVSELFYECLNFYKNRGPTSEYYTGLTTAEKDGFPVITSWDDPIQAWCQKNYIVGINDANPWLDKRLPGTHFTARRFNGHLLRASDYGEPSNPDSDINVTDLTNTVGDLQGLTNTSQGVGCTAADCDMNCNNKNIPGLGEVMGTCPWPGKENSYYVAGLAYYANSRDIRKEANMPGRQSITTFMIDTQEYSANPLTGQMNMLWLTGKYGGFVEKDNVSADPDFVYEPNLTSEWDTDGNGEPDNYVLATDPEKLVNGLNKVFSEISKDASSGTAASVISNSRSGEGAVYQSIFYPEYNDSCLTGPINEVSWIGTVHALFLDDYGNMREDTNTNSTLDLSDDLFIRYEGTDVYKYVDSNGNGKLDPGELTGTVTGPFTLTDIQYLWSSSTWLNSITDLDVIDQRTYTSTDKKRYIFTFIDDGDMVAESGEQVEFVTDLTEITKISPYLHLFNPFEFTPASPPPGIVATDYNTYLGHQTKRVIEYIRGEDQGSLSFGSSTIPAMRSRQIDFGCDGTVETYRMGDVIHSTPTLVGRPSEGYDLIYKDETYQTFYKKYKDRRSVVYVGANDGMLHAFNGGFFDPHNHNFYTQKMKTDPNPPYGQIADTDYINFDLGAEMWAYIPFNLLSHLHWLTDPNYSHVYYVDQKPKIFDARIYDHGLPDTDVHPKGWATLMVCGMRFGGGTIRTDKDKDGVYEPNDPTHPDHEMKSAYFILDITNPEAAPKVLAEFTFSDLGFTTGYPTVILMNPKETTENKWYLAVGSGPIDSNGPGTTALEYGTSNQQAKLYIIDLKELVQSTPEFKDHSGNTLTAAGPAFQTLPDNNSYVSDLISVDFDLDYKTDAVYFGTVSGSHPTWGGKLRRIKINDDLNTGNWDGNSTLIDAGKPITAHPALAQDRIGRMWVYFGTGRFINQDDIGTTQQQTYYGIKEPWSDTNSNGKMDPGEMTWAGVSSGTLLDVSNAKVFEHGDNVTGVAGAANFSELLSAVDGKSGWNLDFSISGERNIGGAALIGDILLFTTYVPDSDPCEFEGNSYLYALYYTTGTAYHKPVIGLGSEVNNNNQLVLKKLDLGKGLTISPNIHTGKEAGSKAYIQSGTGAISAIEMINPGITKSGKGAWLEE